MKQIAAVLVVFFFAFRAFADQAPAVSIEQALSIAEKNMIERGLQKELFIDSVTLTKPAMFNGEYFWFVKWSHPIPAEEAGKHEIGIKVRMNGVATRLVKGLTQP